MAAAFHHRALIGFAVAAVTVGVWSPSLFGGLQSDDFPLVEAALRGGPLATWSGGQPFFRPLASFAFWLDARVWGSAALGFHLTNVVLHVGIALGVGWLAGRLVRPQVPAHATYVGAATALLFAIMPSHSEPVAWVAGRTDLLATAGAVLGTACWLRARERQSPTLHAAALTAFACGLLAKESIVLWPGIFVLLDRCHFGASWRMALRRGAPFAAVAVAYVAARTWAVGELIGAYGADVHFETSRALSNLASMPIRTLLPPLRSGAISIAYPVIGLAGLGLAAQAARRGHARIVVGLVAAWVLAIAPAASLGVDPRNVSGERLLYGPSVVLCIALAAVAAGHVTRRAVQIVAVLIGVAWATSAYASAVVWADAARLAETQARTLAGLDARRIVVGTLLDHRFGAYVFRNGLASAVRLRGDGSLPPGGLVAPVRWLQTRLHYSMQNEARLTGSRISLTTRADGGWMVASHEADVGVEAVTFEEQAPRHFAWMLDDADASDAVVLFDGAEATVCRPGLDCPGAGGDPTATVPRRP